MKTLIFILLSVSCFAQKKNIVYHSLEASYIGLNAMDLISTYKLIGMGGREVNPTMKPFIDNKVEAIAFKAVATFGILALNRQIQKDHQKAALISLIALNAGMGYVVHHNYQVTVRIKLSLPSHPGTP